MMVSRGIWFSTVAVALAMWVAASAVESIAGAAVSRWLSDRAVLGGVMSTIVGIFSMAGGGYVAARLRTGAAHVMACVVLVAVIALILTQGDTVPLWSQLMFLLIGPLGPLLGGELANVHRVRPHQ
jgi:hypothetical protein